MKCEHFLWKVLRRIQLSFYEGRIREFKRDETALIRAISRYGHECRERGWDLDLDFVCADLLALLASIRERRARIEFLPVYLEGAVTRRINGRAEELREAALVAKKKSVVKLVENLRLVSAVREDSAVEALAKVFAGLRGLQRLRRASLKKQAKPAQRFLL